MQNRTVIIIVALYFASSLGLASEVGRSTHRSSNAAGIAAPSPAITDPNLDSRIHVADTFKAANVGNDSIKVAANISADVAHKELVERAKKNAALTTRFSNKNIDVDAFKCVALHKHVNASCYGLKDGFKGGPTLIGAFNPKQITAAYPDVLQQGKILVVRNPQTHIARAVTITDYGPSKKMQETRNRAIDLSSSAFDLFGLRCDKDGVMKDIEIYQCPSS